MKKLCFLLVFVLLLTGCGGQTDPQPESNLVSFDIYAVNDLHGRLTDTDTQPGVNELSTYLTQQPENTILLATGDMWQGTAEANATKGLIVTEWMNRTGFTAMTMGGHEFDWGEEWVRENNRIAEFPLLAINVYSRETNQRVDYCQSSVVVEIDGVQIGIIGAIGDCYSSVSSENTKDIYFQTGSELTALVKAESEKLRSQGVDFIIYTLHDGYDQTTSDTRAMAVEDGALADYYDTALSDGYVDLVFEADSHYWYILTDSQGVYHLQAGGNNAGLAHARVVIDKTNAQALVVAELIPNDAYQNLQPDSMVDELLAKYDGQIAPAIRPLGTNPSYKNNNMLCQLAANLYCAKGVEKWGAEYDIVLGGGYLSCRSPGYLNEGPVSYSQLMSLFPYDNQITLCSIRGSDLLSRFLENDHHAYFIKTTPYGESIRHSIDPDATYYVVTDTYSAYYSYNRMTVIDTYGENVFTRDLLAEYFTEGNFG